MKTIKIIATATVLAASIANAALAGDFDRQIKARQALMQVYAFNLGILGSMVKGQTEYNADLANASAANLLAAAKMNNGAMWPQGSDMAANPGITWAKAETWTTFPAVSEKGKAMVDALEKMVAQADGGLEGLKATIGGVGGGCKGCHDDFRAPKS